MKGRGREIMWAWEGGRLRGKAVVVDSHPVGHVEVLLLAESLLVGNGGVLLWTVSLLVREAGMMLAFGDGVLLRVSESGGGGGLGVWHFDCVWMGFCRETGLEA